MAARANHDKTTFPNLARNVKRYHSDLVASIYSEVDNQVLQELRLAGIQPVGPIEPFRERGEVPTAYAGSLCMWGFKRAWYYWVANGPGVPADRAEEFHKEWGTQVRVDGHCGCPSPRLLYR